MEKQEIGICYECSTKNIDSSKKTVYHCDLCNKWFCETHLNPKFPYFVDWDTTFDVQGDPEVKALFFSEYRRNDGHADFVYLRKTIEALELEEKTRNELIRQAMNRMMKMEYVKESFETAEEKGKRVNLLIMEEMGINQQIVNNLNSVKRDSTKTYDNIFNHHFSVSTEIYSNTTYKERLDKASTLEDVEQIIDEYKNRNNPIATTKKEERKKKHWWQ